MLIIRKKGEAIEFAPRQSGDKARIAAGIYAYRGEEIVCERGHVVGTLNQDLMLGTVFKGDEITGVGVKTGDLVPACSCGAHFSAGDALDQGYLRFREGFRRC